MAMGEAEHQAMSGPRIIEVSRSQPKQHGWLAGCLAEGVFVRECVTVGSYLTKVVAGPMVARCERFEGQCVLRPEWGECRDWAPDLPDPFKVALGVQPRIECEGGPGCRRDGERDE